MKPRPDIIHGRTYHVESGSGSLFVTVNDDEEGKPFEVFAVVGKSGGFVSSFTEAIGRLISLCLRSGVPALLVARQLVGIRGPRTTFYKGKPIFSVPDGIGRVLLEHIGKEVEGLRGVESDPTEDGLDEGSTVIISDEKVE